MRKLAIGCLLALIVAMSIAGCGKEQPAATAGSTQAPAGGMQAMPPHPMPTVPTGEVDLSGIAKADGGKTIAEIYAGKDQLAGQPVSFRGRVVKTNANIMGKNWLHVQDGTGAAGTNDLTVTTLGELPGIGDTVLVTGLVEVNKDFGMGYQYDILIEDAEIVTEARGSD